jgi:hypothetical protein
MNMMETPAVGPFVYVFERHKNFKHDQEKTDSFTKQTAGYQPCNQT